MKFYRHYKNKPYKLLGIARHSETLEELALYETRYENKEGPLWVRPKEMFFESVEVAGKTIPRFAKVELEIIEKTEIQETDFHMLAMIMKAGFGEWDSDWFYSNLRNHPKLHLLIGVIDKNPVGFKLGYEENKDEFYSWLGAVLPEFRGLGIAQDLLTAQHTWCAKQGYKSVRTTTENQFREMLLLNIKSGFDVIGTHLTSKNTVKINLRKVLSK